MSVHIFSITWLHDFAVLFFVKQTSKYSQTEDSIKADISCRSRDVIARKHMVCTLSESHRNMNLVHALLHNCDAIQCWDYMYNYLKSFSTEWINSCRLPIYYTWVEIDKCGQNALSLGAYILTECVNRTHNPLIKSREHERYTTVLPQS